MGINSGTSSGGGRGGRLWKGERELGKEIVGEKHPRKGGGRSVADASLKNLVRIESIDLDGKTKT